MAKTDNDTWTTVVEARNRIVFDADGDTWDGFYEGVEIVHDDNKNEDYRYLNFRGDDGDGYMVSESYMLAKAFEQIGVGTYCRITRTGSKDTRNGTMTNFKVQTRG